MIELKNSSDFDSFISEQLVLVVFFAEWCGPCRMLESVLSDFSLSRSDVKVVKINVDVLEKLARRFGVMSIPTLILFKDGKEFDRKIGYMSQDDLNNWIN